MKQTNAIIILDGYGLRNETHGNAIKVAKTPNLDRYFKSYPNSMLKASGEDVGLPAGQMGNSEVGHLNLGAGRIVYQDISMISNAIRDNSFFSNPALLKAIKNAKTRALHLCGLVSDGGVHSTLEHLYALMLMAKQNDVKNVYIHCITDGRDTPIDSGRGYINQIEAQILKIKVGKIATILGRYYPMDRNSNWDRVKKGYDCIFEAKGEKFVNANDCINSLYKKGLTDEFLTPSVIGDYSGFNPSDSFIFFNFRADRARQISSAATQPNFNLFNREEGYKNPFYVGMTLYDQKLTNVLTAFEPKNIVNTLSQVLEKNNLTQARIAETEKYAHVTFFFNGGVEQPQKGEQRFLVPSPNIKTYDFVPQMSAKEVSQKALDVIGSFDVLILNFANCDMVGHTGDFSAAVKAVETVDKHLSEVIDAVLASNGCALVLADHGNAEMMTYPDKTPMTAHTTSPVPLILISNQKFNLIDGKLCDVAPTFLTLLGIEIPPQMTGKSLLTQIN